MQTVRPSKHNSALSDQIEHEPEANRVACQPATTRARASYRVCRILQHPLDAAAPAGPDRRSPLGLLAIRSYTPACFVPVEQREEDMSGRDKREEDKADQGGRRTDKEMQCKSFSTGQ